MSEETTAVSWSAFRVVKRNYCEPDEELGYFQTKISADACAMKAMEKCKSGICCDNAELVEVEVISIKP